MATGWRLRLGGGIHEHGVDLPMAMHCFRVLGFRGLGFRLLVEVGSMNMALTSWRFRGSYKRGGVSRVPLWVRWGSIGFGGSYRWG